MEIFLKDHETQPFFPCVCVMVLGRNALWKKKSVDLTRAWFLQKWNTYDLRVSRSPQFSFPFETAWTDFKDTYSWGAFWNQKTRKSNWWSQSSQGATKPLLYSMKSWLVHRNPCNGLLDFLQKLMSIIPLCTANNKPGQLVICSHAFGWISNKQVLVSENNGGFLCNRTNHSLPYRKVWLSIFGGQFLNEQVCQIFLEAA